jgi:hypothetical protein
MIALGYLVKSKVDKILFIPGTGCHINGET